MHMEIYLAIVIVDFDNYGVSGIEKYFDRELKNKNLINQPLVLTIDSIIQYLIDKEFNNAIKVLKLQALEHY